MSERLTHLVPEGEQAISAALTEGTPVTSMCGKTWVPARDPDMFPLCAECLARMCEAWAA